MLYERNRELAGYAGVVAGPVLLGLVVVAALAESLAHLPVGLHLIGTLLGAVALFLGFLELRDQRKNKRLDAGPHDDTAFGPSLR